MTSVPACRVDVETSASGALYLTDGSTITRIRPTIVTYSLYLPAAYGG